MTAETPTQDQTPQSGPTALLHALRSIDTGLMEEEARQALKTGTKAAKARAVRVLGILDGLRRNDAKPEDLMITKVPVLPPQMRPFTSIGGTFIPGDANELYGDLLKVRDAYGKLRAALGESNTGEDRLALYGAVKALYGYGEPVNPKTRERGVTGFMKTLTGTSPKLGWVQRRLLSKPVDMVSRGTIIVDPDLGLNQIGVPKEALWAKYAPHIERKLRQAGMTRIEALRQLKERGVAAANALKRLTSADSPDFVPVTYSRAPAWHRFSALAGEPIEVEGEAIHINPYVTAGMGADFDGDNVNIHTPVTDEAIADAKERLMPDKMAFSIRDPDKVMPAPKHEAVLGLFAAGQRPAKAVHTFRTRADFVRAAKSGNLDLSDDVDILDDDDV